MSRSNPSRVSKWTPFVQAELPDLSPEEMARRTGFSVEQIQEYLAANPMNEEVSYLNNLYQVNIRRCKPEDGVPAMLHVSIKRRDKGAVHDWRHFQRIKNELVGPECEAVELYPAESRLVDGANQYHLWAIEAPGVRFPLGFAERLVDDNGPIGGKQRPGGYGTKPNAKETP